MSHPFPRARAIVIGVVTAITVAVATAVAVPAAAAPSATPSLGIVVKIGRGPTDPLSALLGLLRGLPLTLDVHGTGSSGLFLVQPTDPAVAGDPAAVSRLTRQLAASPNVAYAEPNLRGGLLIGLGLHAWPDGPPVAVGTDAARWSGQPAATDLRLDDVHRISTGRGVTVAVLDTGVDASHPVLAGKVAPGYDFVDDDADSSDRATGSDSNGDGVPDEAVGHGTSVAGTVELVAPGARILPYRVLDSDGTGTTYTAARAINAATDAGASVINLSFGIPDGTTSSALADAVSRATQRGVTVVAAAGNTGDTGKIYPAAQSGVLSVTALDADGTGLAAFATRGDWVKVAAPGQGIVGPIPGGQFARWSGTSLAAPFVSGQAALIRGRLPIVLAANVTNAVLGTAERKSGVSYGAVDVYGSLNPIAGLWPVGNPLGSFLPSLRGLFG